MKKCKAKKPDGTRCGKPFEPKFSSIEKWCSTECALAIVKENNTKEKKQKELQRKRADRERKANTKTKGEHMREAQAAFNAYIRYRDKDLPCINTGLFVDWDGNNSDAAHFISRSACSALRFDLRNVHKSTKASNKMQDKYIHDYKVYLKDRIGPKRYKELMQDFQYYRVHQRKFDIEYLQRIKRIFRKKLRLYKKLRES